MSSTATAQLAPPVIHSSRHRAASEAQPAKRRPIPVSNASDTFVYRIPAKNGASSISTSFSDSNLLSPLSIASTSSESFVQSGPVSSKRQAEFRRYFETPLTGAAEDVLPDDFWLVLATQSGDLQGLPVLVHGRLYLTRYHLCFHANILGIITDRVHPLKSITAVEKGTTAKWIQNAIYVTVPGENEGRYYGYGSLADRDKLHAQVTECWRAAAPKLYDEFAAAQAAKKSSPTSPSPSPSPTPKPAMITVSDADEDIAANIEKAEKGEESAKTADCKETEASTEKLKEVAIDTKLPISLEAAFKLLYMNKEFTQSFLEVDEGLKDVKISEWAGEQQSRTMTYIMQVSNPVGPSESECNGSETILVSDPETSYEVESFTETPGVPSGKSFKVHTLTCLTHTTVNGSPGTRVYATSQVDWSSSSWLKGPITSAVTKGQKQHYDKLVAAALKWIQDRPKEYGSESAERLQQVKEVQARALSQTRTGHNSVGVTASSIPKKTITDCLAEIPRNPIMMAITLLCAALVLRDIHALLSARPEIVIYA